MKKAYTAPRIIVVKIDVEAGFQSSNFTTKTIYENTLQESMQTEGLFHQKTSNNEEQHFFLR
ncbi:MAG: hypothetical protein MJZ67_02785 [Bacteroidales bacterium]|nr:hypothetical protein [Bacteroidales bacterium]